jgi:PAS domain S-box-containing protein
MGTAGLRRGGRFWAPALPPRFEDEQKTERARMVYWMAGTIALVTAVSQLLLMALVPESTPRFAAILAVVLVVCAGDLALARRGWVMLAGWFQTVALWGLLSAAAWTTGGVGGASVTAQLVVVALGGLLVGWRGGLGFGALALATIVAMAAAESAGMLPPPTLEQTPATRAVTVGTYVVALAVIQLLVMRNLEGARDRAVREVEERRGAESFANSIIDSAPGVFYTIDGHGRRLRWNRQFEELTGLTTEEFAALDILGTLVEEDRELVKRKVAETLESGSAQVVARIQSPAGPRAHLFTGRRAQIEGKPCVVGFGADITDRLEAEAALRRSEEEVRRLNTDLERSVRERTAQLEEALRALESFSYSVSHDLRAPLRAINGFATLLETDYGIVLDAEAARMLARIREGTTRMARLIDDLLSFSRLQSHAESHEEVDMGVLVREAFDQVAEEGRSGSVRLSVGDLPTVRGDPTLLRQVWANLLGNALKFTNGSPDAAIDVTWLRAADDDVFSVRDNGVGFDQEYADKLFTVFERLHGDEYEGTGIGLAICRRIVEAHGGRVWCEAAEGRGAIFSFSLPATVRHAPVGEGSERPQRREFRE